MSGIHAKTSAGVLGAGLALLAALPLLSGCAQQQREPRLSEAERQANIESFDAIWTTIRDRHWDPTLGGLDWQGVRD